MFDFEVEYVFHQKLKKKFKLIFFNIFKLFLYINIKNKF